MQHAPQSRWRRIYTEVVYGVWSGQRTGRRRRAGPLCRRGAASSHV